VTRRARRRSTTTLAATRDPRHDRFNVRRPRATCTRCPA